jgi:hypothetical protein
MRFSNAGGLYADNFYQNQNVVNSHLSALATYAASSGGCWSGDNWPKNWAGHTSVGIIGCLTSNSGSISNVQRADARTNHGGRTLRERVGGGPKHVIHEHVLHAPLMTALLVGHGGQTRRKPEAIPTCDCSPEKRTVCRVRSSVVRAVTE